jgi:predicted amidohydrolase
MSWDDGTAYDERALVDALRDAGEELFDTVAVLWTWLGHRIQLLGGLLEPEPVIYEAAMRAEPFEELDEDLLRWIADDPVRNAAELLARIDYRFADRKTPLLGCSRGIDGDEVLVAWRSPSLARALHEGRKAATVHDGRRLVPPAANVHPSLSALAPGLIVSPTWCEGIRLRPLELELEWDRREWNAAQRRLENGLAKPLAFELHMDTLGASGLSGWMRCGEGIARIKDVDPVEDARCAKAARRAVGRACGTSTVLLMPELAASELTRRAVCAEMARRKLSPALAVFGLHHQEAPADESRYNGLVRRESLAGHVNEAVVVGPAGKELWRHRKLARAEAPGEMIPPPTPAEAERRGLPATAVRRTEVVVEDARAGDTLAVVTSPLGTIAIPICIDLFAPASHERLRHSPADVLLVPSLSKTVVRHRMALRGLLLWLWGIAFVCNRFPSPAKHLSAWNEDENRSFWASQRTPEFSFERRAHRAHPSFVFRLADRGAQEGKTPDAGRMNRSAHS